MNKRIIFLFETAQSYSRIVLQFYLNIRPFFFRKSYFSQGEDIFLPDDQIIDVFLEIYGIVNDGL